MRKRIPLRALYIKKKQYIYIYIYNIQEKEKVKKKQCVSESPCGPICKINTN
jgi:hypothetical protein